MYTFIVLYNLYFIIDLYKSVILKYELLVKLKQTEYLLVTQKVGPIVLQTSYLQFTFLYVS